MVPKLFITVMTSSPRAKVSAVIKRIQSRIAIPTMHLASDRFGRSVNAAISAFRETPGPVTLLSIYYDKVTGAQLQKASLRGAILNILQAGHFCIRQCCRNQLKAEGSHRRCAGTKKKVPGHSQSAGDTYESTASL